MYYNKNFFKNQIFVYWCRRLGLNQYPDAYEAAAPPIELLRHMYLRPPLNRPYERAAARFLREVAFRSADRTSVV